MENEMLDNIITLTDENGANVDFEFLDLIDYQNKGYVVLLPVGEQSDEVVILQVENIDAENENYLSVEDENILMRVFEIFKEKHKDEFNFED